MIFTWTPPDPLNDTAKTKSIYMTELQVAANVRRVEIAQSQLSFINQNIGKKFILSAIEELKTVTNQLAIDFGYPTGVEDSALLGRPYVTITKKYGKSVCHYPILNDLRLVLNALVIQTGLIFGYVLKHPTLSFDNVANLGISGGPLNIKYQFKPQFGGRSNGISLDFNYLYRLYVTPTTSTIIYKDNPYTGINNVTKSISPWQAQDIVVDENYVWLVGYIYISPGNFNWQIKKLAKNTLAVLQTHTIVSQVGKKFWSICNDKDYFYVVVTEEFAGPGYTRNRTKIRKYNKTDFSYVEYLINANLTTQLPGYEKWIEVFDISIDSSYIYVTYYENNMGMVSERASAILKLNKATMTLNTVIEQFSNLSIYPEPFDYSAISVSNNYIYVIPRYYPAGVWKVVIYNKSGGLLYSSSSIEGQAVINTIYLGSLRHLVCNKDEYTVTLS